ncbi:MAG: hypothetical protein KBA40_00065 [Candidatus Peribacteraceae bacterium]|nr:hypothetical protein [Candidatus Peribacteraceae bacterium]MBP9850069.1 hypothetical protein [Candidatus Peribacteraceae bacterium]
MRSQNDYRRGAGSSDEEEEQQSSSEIEVADQVGHSLIQKFAGALGVRTTDGTLIDQDRRREVEHHREPGTYTSYIDELRKIEAHTAVPEVELSTKRGLMIGKAHGVLIDPQSDKLEMVRKQMGLDEQREELLSFLESMLDPKDGFLSFKRDTALLGTAVSSMGDVKQKFPELTVAELSCLPLLTQTPKHYLLYGAEEDTRKRLKTFFEAGRMENDDINPFKDRYLDDPRKRIPQVLALGVHGISYTRDTHHFVGKHDLDSMSAPAGLSNFYYDVETVPYERLAQESIAQLIPLTISSGRLYERVFLESTESLSVGMGKVSAYVGKKLGIWDESRSVEDNVSDIRGEQRKVFNAERRRTLQLIMRHQLYDPVRTVSVQGKETVKLIGILDDIPECLLNESGFQGFIVPSGTTLQFYDHEGTLLSSTNYSRHYSRLALQGMYEESTDDKKENRTMLELAQRLMKKVNEHVLQMFQSDPSAELSTIEEMMVDSWLQFSVILAALPELDIKDTSTMSDDHHRVGRYHFAQTTMKVGAKESAQYYQTLKLLGKELLTGIQLLQKQQAYSNSLRNMTRGQVTVGEYEIAKKKVSIYEIEEIQFTNLTEISQAERSMTILHEGGESVWAQLDAEIQNRWQAISWQEHKPKAKNRRSKQRHFLTSYSQHDAKEDFCEHFACYILHGPEFRHQAKGEDSRSILAKKYRFISEVISLYTGQEKRYGNVIPWSIEEINGAVHQQVQRMSIEEALRSEQEDLEISQLDSQDELDEMVQSFEDVDLDNENEVREEENEDTSHEEDEATSGQRIPDAISGPPAKDNEELADRKKIGQMLHRVEQLLIEALGERRLRRDEQREFDVLVEDIHGIMSDAKGTFDEKAQADIKDELKNHPIFCKKVQRVLHALEENNPWNTESSA